MPDAIEVFAPSATAVDDEDLRELLIRHSLKLAAVGTGAGMVKHKLSLTDADAGKRGEARSFVKSIIDWGARFKAPAIIGSMQGRHGNLPGQVADRVTAMDHLRRALGELGAAYRYETPVFVRAADGDSSAAEVLIIGRGDPTFSARFHETDYSVTDTMADAIAAAGIRRVGDITIDASFFGDRPVHGTWEVADLTEAFAAPV